MQQIDRIIKTKFILNYLEIHDVSVSTGIIRLPGNMEIVSSLFTIMLSIS